MKKRVLASLLVVTFLMATMLSGCGLLDMFAKKEESITAERGVIKDGRYTNESLDFSFAVTEDMTPMTDSELIDGLGLAGVSSGYTLQTMETYNEGTSYDIAFYLPDMATNVIVGFENMDVTSEGVWVKSMAYAEILAERMKTEEGFTVLTEPYSVELNGKEYARFEVQQGWATQTCVVRQEKNYIILVILTHKGDNAWVEEVLSTFSTAQ